MPRRIKVQWKVRVWPEDRLKARARESCEKRGGPAVLDALLGEKSALIKVVE